MKVRAGVAGALLLGAVAVDFTSRLMSTGFDLFFIALAVFVIYPVVKGKKQ